MWILILNSNTQYLTIFKNEQPIFYISQCTCDIFHKNVRIFFENNTIFFVNSSFSFSFPNAPKEFELSAVVSCGQQKNNLIFPQVFPSYTKSNTVCDRIVKNSQWLTEKSLLLYSQLCIEILKLSSLGV